MAQYAKPNGASRSHSGLERRIRWRTERGEGVGMLGAGLLALFVTSLVWPSVSSALDSRAILHSNRQELTSSGLVSRHSLLPLSTWIADPNTRLASEIELCLATARSLSSGCFRAFGMRAAERALKLCREEGQTKGPAYIHPAWEAEAAEALILGAVASADGFGPAIGQLGAQLGHPSPGQVNSEAQMTYGDAGAATRLQGYLLQALTARLMIDKKYIEAYDVRPFINGLVQAIATEHFVAEWSTEVLKALPPERLTSEVNLHQPASTAFQTKTTPLITIRGQATGVTKMLAQASPVDILDRIQKHLFLRLRQQAPLDSAMERLLLLGVLALSREDVVVPHALHTNLKGLLTLWGRASAQNAAFISDLVDQFATLPVSMENIIRGVTIDLGTRQLPGPQ